MLASPTLPCGAAGAAMVPGVGRHPPSTTAPSAAVEAVFRKSLRLCDKVTSLRETVER
jgi:hypothetical protein